MEASEQGRCVLCGDLDPNLALWGGVSQGSAVWIVRGGVRAGDKVQAWEDPE